MEDRNNLRQGWIDYMSRNERKYFITITFKPNTPDRVSEKSIDKFIEEMNRALLHRAFTKRGLSIKGVAVKERSRRMSDALHYHMLFFKGDIAWPAFNKLQHKMAKHVERINKINGKEIVIYDGWEVQKCYQSEGNILEQYITKNFNNPSISTKAANDSIGLIGAGGVAFGSNELVKI